MKPHATILLALCAITASAPALAADAIKPGARIAASCSGCHGTNGVTQGKALPSLAGQPRNTLLEKLKAYKTGTAQSTIMTQIAKGYTDEQIEMLATYFAAQKGSDPTGPTQPLGSKY
jgi:sulfide dehydrogenase cytochrome subunit